MRGEEPYELRLLVPHVSCKHTHLDTKYMAITCEMAIIPPPEQRHHTIKYRER